MAEWTQTKAEAGVGAGAGAGAGASVGNGSSRYSFVVVDTDGTVENTLRVAAEDEEREKELMEFHAKQIHLVRSPLFSFSSIHFPSFTFVTF